MHSSSQKAAVTFSAVAASAPLLYLPGLTPCNAFNQRVTDVFAREGRKCVENIRKIWEVLRSMLDTGCESALPSDHVSHLLFALSFSFQLCRPRRR